MDGKHISLRCWAVLCVVLIGGGILWKLIIHESIQEGRCTLVPRKIRPDTQLTGLAAQILEPLSVRPANLGDLPADFNHPCFYRLESGAGSVTVVLNAGKGPRLCLDRDGDGDLSGEPCFDATEVLTRGNDRGEKRFGPLSLAAQDIGDRDAGQFYVHHYAGEGAGPLFVFPVYYRMGRLRLNGRVYRVAVVDGDYDGRLNSILTLPQAHSLHVPHSDVFAIDLNRNNTFELSEWRDSEIMPLGRYVKVLDAYYAIKIAGDGTRLTLTETEPQFGTLVLEPNDMVAELKLWSNATDQCLVGREWSLPVGKYKAIRLGLEKKDAQGNVWSFSSNLASARIHLGALDYFEITPGGTTAFRIGPPFAVRTSIEKKNSNILSLAPVIVGCAGEEYNLGCTRDNHARKPTFRIVDRKGTVLADDAFKFG